MSSPYPYFRYKIFSFFVHRDNDPILFLNPQVFPFLVFVRPGTDICGFSMAGRCTCARFSADHRCASATSLAGGEPPRDRAGSSTGQRRASDAAGDGLGRLGGDGGAGGARDWHVAVALFSVYIYPFFIVSSLNFRWHRGVFRNDGSECVSGVALTGCWQRGARLTLFTSARPLHRFSRRRRTSSSPCRHRLATSLSPRGPSSTTLPFASGSYPRAAVPSGTAGIRHGAESRQANHRARGRAP